MINLNIKRSGTSRLIVIVFIAIIVIVGMFISGKRDKMAEFEALLGEWGLVLPVPYEVEEFVERRSRIRPGLFQRFFKLKVPLDRHEEFLMITEGTWPVEMTSMRPLAIDSSIEWWQRDPIAKAYIGRLDEYGGRGAVQFELRIVEDAAYLLVYDSTRKGTAKVHRRK